MPTFDPIRDADLTNRRERPRTTSRESQVDVHGPTGGAPREPVRRVLTLAMILNDDPENPPLSAHRVSLSPTMSTPRSNPPIPSFHQPPSDSASAPTQPTSLSPSTLSPTFLKSPSHPSHPSHPLPLPPHSAPRPHQSQMLPPPFPIPQPLLPLQSLAYNPNRITPPNTILNPVTKQDLECFQRPDNPLRRALGIPPSLLQSTPRSPSSATSSRKRSRDPDDDGDDHDDDMAVKKKRARNDVIVALHYNARPEVGLKKRRESPIFGLKNFNNWVKSVLIHKFAHQPLEDSKTVKPSARGALQGRVLDIGCGKGGDLQKWAKARIKDYVGVDIAAISVNQARDRWESLKTDRWDSLKTDRFDAWFSQLDAYHHPLKDAPLPPEVLLRGFDVVSMQFCMHYAFENEAAVHQMLDNVARYLRKGGRFIGTIPDQNFLMDKVREIPNSPEPEFGNDVYHIKFDTRDRPNPSYYGHRYHFYLKDAVGDVPEFVVYWPNFETVAKQHNLRLLYKRNFHHIYREEHEHPEYGPLLRKMKVVNEREESTMDPDQWDVAEVYLAFAFEKEV